MEDSSSVAYNGKESERPVVNSTSLSADSGAPQLSAPASSANSVFPASPPPIVSSSSATSEAKGSQGLPASSTSSSVEPGVSHPSPPTAAAGLTTPASPPLFSSSYPNSCATILAQDSQESRRESNTLGAGADIDWKKRGNEAFKREDYKKAIEFYTNGIEFDPSNAALFSNRSAAYLKAEEYEKAQADAEVCIAINSKWPKGFWRKGQALLEQERYGDAVKAYEEGLKSCDNDPHLLSGKRKAQKFLEISQAHKRGLAADDDVLNENSRAGATAFMAAIDSQNKFAPEAESTANPEEARQKAFQNGTKASSDTPAARQSHNFPGTQEQEIARIISAPNYYAVLHVSNESTMAEMKKNYHTLARMLHPDKCQLEGADNAMKEVVQAYGTLTNPLKKTLYDQYMKDRRDSQTSGEQQTYAEWEAKQQPVNMPKWLRVLLGIKGCAWVITVVFFILMIPLFLIALVVILIVWLICLPYRTILRCCFPEKYAQMLAEHERERQKMEEEAQDRMHAHL